MTDSNSNSNSNTNSMTITLLLFDVDGVLLHPQGYKEALRDTVSYFAHRMGQSHIIVNDETIAYFESLGVTSEWESVPFCVGSVLKTALIHHPDALAPTLDQTLLNLASESTVLDAPAFETAAQKAVGNGFSGRASHRFLDYFKTTTPSATHRLWDTLLNDVYDMRTPTTAIFQAHTLGNERYQQTYGEPPGIDRDSYLLTYDKPALNASLRQHLLQTIDQKTIGASIFTARPSLPPADIQTDIQGYAPEADLAAELVQMDNIPMIAAGRLGWLARQQNRSPSDYIKPSPVHALAGMLAAIGGPESEALLAAAEFVDRSVLPPLFEHFRGKTVQTIVFEDSIGGIQSTMQAVGLLQDAGFDFTCTAIGVAVESSKKRALKENGAHVVPDVNNGVSWVLEDLLHAR